mgnify:CR=1 FL=1
MQSWMALLVAGMLIGPITGATVASAESLSVPPEIQSVVDAAYADWQGSLGARQECSSGVSLVYDELPGRRGEYRTDSAQVVIDPTDSVAGMAAIVVHELSHHTFLACGVFADTDLSAAFYAAQGIPADRGWFDYSRGWSETPAEHFAEALAVTIGSSGEGDVVVGEETVTLLARWLAGAPVSEPAPTYEPEPYSASGESTTLVAVGDDSTEAAVAAIPATSQVEVKPVNVASQRNIFRAALQKVLQSVYWLTSWKVITPI